MLPQEIELFYVIPALRCIMTKELVAFGLRQKEIAKKLGITEAAVSQYVKGKRAAGTCFDAVTMLAIKKSAGKIAHDKSGFLKEIMHLSGIVKKTGAMCGMHRKHGNPSKDCAICRK